MRYRYIHTRDDNRKTKKKKKTQNIRCSRVGRVGIFGKGAGGAGWVVLSAKQINESHDIILIY